MHRVGDVVELAQGESLGLCGSVARGTKGVVLREPGLMSKGYLLRLDAGGRQVELPAEALRRSSGDVWSSSPVAKAPGSVDPPWWRQRSSASSQAPPRRPGTATPPPPAPVVRAKTTWRSAGDGGGRAPLAAGDEPRRPARSSIRRSPAETVDELMRRLGRRRRRGGADARGRTP